MHRFYMVQSFTRFHRNVRTQFVILAWSAFDATVSRLLKLTLGSPSSSGHRPCGALPRCQGGGAAPKAGTCHQGGPRLPQPSGAVSGHPQRCECLFPPPRIHNSVWLRENVSLILLIVFFVLRKRCTQTLCSVCTLRLN